MKNKGNNFRGNRWKFVGKDGEHYQNTHYQIISCIRITCYSNLTKKHVSQIMLYIKRNGTIMISKNQPKATYQIDASIQETLLLLNMHLFHNIHLFKT